MSVFMCNEICSLICCLIRVTAILIGLYLIFRTIERWIPIIQKCVKENREYMDLKQKKESPIQDNQEIKKMLFKEKWLDARLANLSRLDFSKEKSISFYNEEIQSIFQDLDK